MASRYPADNQFPTIAVYNANFLNPAGQDYRLQSGSAYRGASLDGRDLGCDFDAACRAGATGPAQQHPRGSLSLGPA